MTSLSPALRFACCLAAPLIMAPLSAAASQAANPPAAGRPPSAGTATADIIPLPLNPIVASGQRLCGSKTASGLGYSILRPTTGPTPTDIDYVLVNYIGYLSANGVVFDQGMGRAFPVGAVIAGFSEGLKMMAKGTVARFCIPAALGYGSKSSDAIPADSDLVFQVELLDYKSATEIEAMRGPGMDQEDSMHDDAAANH